jgi:alpha-tubulin suppressor-like RCC1 family protein
VDLGSNGLGQAQATVAVEGKGTIQVEASTGELSAGATITSSAVSYASVFAGGEVTCGVTTEGATYCWGYNGFGSLGAGFFSDPSLPLRVVGSTIFTFLAPGTYTSCGLTSAGATYCWGSVGPKLFTPDTSAQVEQFARPVATALGFTFTTLTNGGSHVCGLTPAGKAYCWGTARQLGTGSDGLDAIATPQPVAGDLTFSSISAGASTTCGTTPAGAAYCWGDNTRGILGNGDTTVHYSPVPVAVAGGHAFTTVSVSDYRACGLTTAGEAYCWGDNYQGILGATSDEVCVPEFELFVPCSSVPLAVSGGLAFERLGANSLRCGLTGDGTVYCWPGPDSLAPAPVPGSLHWLTMVVGGGGQMCGRAEDDLVHCWGANQRLQLGAPGEPSEPVTVVGQQ